MAKTYTVPCTLNGAAATTYSGTYYVNNSCYAVGKYDGAFHRTKISVGSNVPDGSKITSATLRLYVSSHGTSTAGINFGLYEAYKDTGYQTTTVSSVKKYLVINNPGTVVSIDITAFLQASITSLMFLATSEVSYSTAWIQFGSADVLVETNEVECTLSYDLQGGDGSFTPQTATGTTSVSFTISSTVPTRDGYSFEGWATSAGGAVSYQPSETITVTGDVTLYAVWSAQTCTVTFDANGGTVSPTTMTVNYGQAYGTLPTPTRTTGTFSGWYYGDTLITSTSIVSTLEDHTLVADWGMTSPFYMKMTDGVMKPAYVFRRTASGMSQCTVYMIDEDGALTN